MNVQHAPGRLFIAMAVVVSLPACASMGSHAPLNPQARTSSLERRDAIQRAGVWTATDVASMDIMTGPVGPGAFAVDATVTCDYREKAAPGNSPKFTCVIPPSDEVKVKFGPGNGEVYAEVAASRLLWALGFGADRMYPVHVICHGCPKNIQGTTVASIQRKMPGKDIETTTEVGWGWPELDFVGPNATPEMRAERDALKLLAAFLQHTDSKAEQQRLICLSGPGDAAPCERPFMMVHDLGLTFGAANRFNRNSVGSTNFDQWSQAKIWKDGPQCVANLTKSRTGTLDNPVISEAGRQFLARLLSALTDTQIHDLFTVARFTLRSATDDGPPVGISIDAWVGAFKAKRSEIVDRSCAAPPPALDLR